MCIRDSCYFAITNITYIDNRGVSHTGIAAARNLRKEKQRWEGVLDKAALQAVIDEYRKVNEEYPIRQGDYTANLLHDSKVQGFSEIKDMINMGFCEFRDFNYYRIDSVSKDEVGKLYDCLLYTSQKKICLCPNKRKMWDIVERKSSICPTSYLSLPEIKFE